jgi:hypothetical protein
MLIREFSGEHDSDAKLVSVLEFLRNRAHNKKLTPTIGTPSLINMVKNLGGSEFFNYENLEAAQQRNPTVGALIKSLDREKITLQPFGDELDASEVEQAEANKEKTSTPNPEKTVDSMAKRALSKRS